MRQQDLAGFIEYFPLWHKLNSDQQQLLRESVCLQRFEAGALLHNGEQNCAGLFVVRSGQLRAYRLSEEGREVTICRLFERDVCLLSAACVMRSVHFDLTVQAEKPSEVWVIPPHVYEQLTAASLPMANFAFELLADRFSDAMELLDRILWTDFDRRLADFLLNESRLENKTVLKLTHEAIANHLGTAREVVTRMLRRFQTEGLVRLSRGTVELLDLKGLEAI